MCRTKIVGTWVGVLAVLVVVFGGLMHASRTDPEGHVERAYGAVHGVVISPYGGIE